MDSLSIEGKIFVIRNHRVMLSTDLAALYGVSPKRLNEQVRRNRRRFPEDFMFKLTHSETRILRSQLATLKGGRGTHSKYPAIAFTEQGVAMLSSVLNSERAIHVNIAIMRAFVRFRELVERLLEEHSSTLASQSQEIQRIFEILRQMTEPRGEPRKRIGYLP